MPQRKIQLQNPMYYFADFFIFDLCHYTTPRPLISFDWAIKRLLRQKANFGILEGFLTELLQQEINVKSIPESETNKQREDDKTSRVDILCENSNEELMLIELQYYAELDFLAPNAVWGFKTYNRLFKSRGTIWKCKESI
jgi:hypothetical protein